MEEDLSISSVCHVPNCKEGHCSCYYCNWNRCCRCGSTQLAHKPVLDYVSRTPPMEREWKTKKRVDPGPEYYTEWVNPLPNAKDGTRHTEAVRYERDPNDDIV